MRNARMLITAVFAMQLALLVPLSLSAGRPIPPANKTRMYYSVQVLAAAEDSDAFLRVYESLRKKGYLAYYGRARVDERSYLRLRVGVFASRPEAIACAGQLRTTEGLDGFVTTADVAVNVFKDQFLVATTPSGIWLKSGASARELYRFAPLKSEIEPRIARISPRGDAVAFYDENRILTISLGTGGVKVLRQGTQEDSLWSSGVRWSPDGRFLAYLDDATWESPTRLWVMQADGTENRCLVSDDSRQTKVKSFLWHPRQNRIFYVMGPTYGTVSVGGSLWSTDLQGNRRQIVTAGVKERTEVYHEFRIAGNVLSYTLAHFDENMEVREYTSHTLVLDALD